MIKVLHVQLLPLLSGVQRVSLNEIIEVDKDYPMLCEFSLVCSSEGPLTAEMNKNNVDVFTIPELKRAISPWNDIKALFKLYKLIKNSKFDVVHTHSSKTGLLGRIAAKLAGTPIVVHTVHGFSFPSAKNIISKLTFYLMEWFAKFFTSHLIVLNKTDFDISVDQLRYCKKKVHIIPNGVNITKFQPSEKKQDTFRVVMLGRLWEQKNPMCLVRAAALLVTKYPNIEIDFIGDGELRNEIDCFLEDNSLMDNVKVLGWSDNVECLLGNYDLFVLPSLWEGMPLAILEAQACGLPTIVSDIPGNSDLVMDGLNGFLFEKNNHIALSNLIEKVYLDPVLCKKLSLYSREHVSDNYSCDIRNNKVINLYQES